jgi:ankyrin repeat protein
MSFLSLPNEILLLVAENLTENPQDFYHLLSTSHRIYHLTISRFHRLAHLPKDGEPALHWAARRGHISLLLLLLAQGVDVNLRNKAVLAETALHSVAEVEAVPVIIRTLLKNGAGVNLQDAAGVTPLSKAMSFQNYELVKALLDEADTDVNIPNNKGITALHWVALEGRDATFSRAEELIKLLLSKGAYIDQQDYSNMSALYLAISRNHKPTIRLLLHHGANLFLQRELGYTGIRRAVMHNDTEMVELFLQQKGVDVNYRDQSGKTVLHCAASLTISEEPWDLKNVIKLLVEKGADPRIQDNCGAVPLTLARSPSDEIKRLLDPGTGVHTCRR